MDDPFDLESIEFETRALIKDIAALTGESRSRVIHTALRERHQRLTAPIDAAERRQSLINALQSSIWSHLPNALRRPISREEEDKILGYGPEGV